MPLLSKEIEKGLTTTWYDSESEGEWESANTMMACSEREEFEDEFNS